jgi:hypothetical protein
MDSHTTIDTQSWLAVANCVPRHLALRVMVLSVLMADQLARFVKSSCWSPSRPGLCRDIWTLSESNSYILYAISFRTLSNRDSLVFGLFRRFDADKVATSERYAYINQKTMSKTLFLTGATVSLL